MSESGSLHYAYGCYLGDFVRCLTVCVDVSLTLLFVLETHFCLLGCLVQTQYEGRLLPCLSVSCSILFECCVFDICFFLKKTQKAMYLRERGGWGELRGIRERKCSWDALSEKRISFQFFLKKDVNKK